MPEDWGGTTVFVDVSAKQKTNLNLLMEMILPGGRPAGTQGDAGSSRNRRGSRSQAGSRARAGGNAAGAERNLRTSDNFVVGNVYGKVRAMFDDRGNSARIRATFHSG